MLNSMNKQKMIKALEDEARAWFKKLEDGDQEATELWQWFRDESLQEFNKIYDMLEVSFDSLNGEAFYNDKMTEVVELLEEKHLLQRRSRRRNR